ncbi:MAG: hypothetical protein M3Q39_00615, partial [Actinomycetota bacterium]|nr:hypothetical protein [Actinomycetota bacterium]
QRISGVLGRGTPLADEFAQVRLGGDLALFHGLGRYLLEAEDTTPGTVLDRAFLQTATEGFDDYAAHVRSLDWTDIESGSGLPRARWPAGGRRRGGIAPGDDGACRLRAVRRRSWPARHGRRRGPEDMRRRPVVRDVLREVIGGGERSVAQRAAMLASRFGVEPTA